MSKAEFIEQANSICRASKEKIAKGGIAIFKQVGDDEHARHDLEANAVESLLIPTLEAEVEQIRELGAPVGDEARVNAILGAIEAPIQEARLDPLSYVQAEGHYRPGSQHYGRASELAVAYGLTGCPQG